MKVLTACANGSGTSLMLMRTAKKTLEKMGFNITQCDHTSVSEAKGTATPRSSSRFTILKLLISESVVYGISSFVYPHPVNSILHIKRSVIFTFLFVHFTPL